jgi:hypothetical protein
LPSRSTTRTIRLEDDLNQEIERLAKAEGTSVNFIINSALREYTEWTTVSRKFGLAYYPLALANRLIQKLSDSEIEELGRWSARETFIPFTEYQFGELNFKSFLEAERRFSKYSGRFEFDYIDKGNSYIILLKHGSGRRWSLYYSSLLQTVIKDLLKIDAELEITDEVVVTKIVPDSKN